MKGIIRPKSSQTKCPVCGDKFLHVPKLGYGCLKCKTVPKKFYVDLRSNGKRLRIFSDKGGQVLDTYDRALRLQAHIQYEIDNHSFDASRYSAADLKKYWAETLLDRFLEDRLPSVAPSYKKDYTRYVHAAKMHFKNTDVREIRKADLINYKKFVETGYSPIGKTAKTIRKGKTVKNYLDVFKTFMAYLKNDLEMISILPSFPDVEVEEFDWQWLDAETQAHILSFITEEDRHIVIFLMLHGCRPGEARALKCKDVNLSAGNITIASTFSGKEIHNKRKGKKAKPVVIPIHPEFYDYMAERIGNNLPEASLFVNPRTHNPYTMSGIQRLWDSARKSAGMAKELRLYDATRHSFASILVNNDISLLSVSRLMGHSTTKMTERYAHSNIEKLRADMAKLTLQVKGGNKVVSINTRMAAN